MFETKIRLCWRCGTGGFLWIGGLTAYCFRLNFYTHLLLILTQNIGNRSSSKGSTMVSNHSLRIIGESFIWQPVGVPSGLSCLWVTIAAKKSCTKFTLTRWCTSTNFWPCLRLPISWSTMNPSQGWTFGTNDPMSLSMPDDCGDDCFLGFLQSYNLSMSASTYLYRGNVSCDLLDGNRPPACAMVGDVPATILSREE